MVRACSRGLACFGLRRDGSLRDKLFDIRDIRAHRDRCEGVIIDGIDCSNKRMVSRWFRAITITDCYYPDENLA